MANAGEIKGAIVYEHREGAVMTTLKSSTEKQIQNIRMARMKLADMTSPCTYGAKVSGYHRLYNRALKRAKIADEFKELLIALQ